MSAYHWKDMFKLLLWKIAGGDQAFTVYNLYLKYSRPIKAKCKPVSWKNPDICRENTLM